jgi:hypothetical protein
MGKRRISLILKLAASKLVLPHIFVKDKFIPDKFNLSDFEFKSGQEGYLVALTCPHGQTAFMRSVKNAFPAGKLPVHGQFRVTCMAIASAVTTNVRRIQRYL